MTDGGDATVTRPARPAAAERTDRADSTDTDPAAARRVVRAAPGANLLALLAALWLLASVTAARLTIGDSPTDDPLDVVRAAMELPRMVGATLLAGWGLGLAAAGFSVRRTAGPRPLPWRMLLGTLAGLLVGAALAARVWTGYADLPGIRAAALALLVAATLGGLLSALPPPPVAAAGLAGALGATLTSWVVSRFAAPLRSLFGGGDTPQAVLAASGRVLLASALLAGAVAGVLAYAYLRRRYARSDPTVGPSSRWPARWPAYPVAGATAGALAVLAEPVTRVGGARFVDLVARVSGADLVALDYLADARFNHALVVLFAGALTATLLVGRTIKRPEADTAPADSAPAGTAAAGADATDSGGA